MADQHQSPPPEPPRPPVDAGAAATPPPPPAGGYPYPMMPPPQSKGRGVISKLLTSVLVSLFLVSLVTNVYLGIIVASLTAGPSESVYQEGDSTERIVILPVIGGIDSDMAEFMRKAVQPLEDDPPAAIILRVESGGGTVGASDQIWHVLQQYRQRHPDVPLVASFGSVAASGGYYISMPAQHIFCEEAGITGSIGVIAQVPTIGELLDKIGVDMQVVTADESDQKDVANNPFRAWSEEDQRTVKRLVNAFYDRFREVVKQGRPMLSEQELENVATGRIFTANEAAAAQLIDEVGYLGDAIQKAADLAGITGKPTVKIIRKSQPFGLLTLIGGSSHPPMAAAANLDAQQVRTLLADLAQVEFAYRLQLR